MAGALPDGLSALRADAAAEGFRFVERLVEEWQAGKCRFDGPGEVLLAAGRDAVLAAIGGLTADPSDPAALRMRRFYVRPRFRGLGLGRALADRLAAPPLAAGMRLTVNAGTAEAATFWERLGFRPEPGPHRTHLREPSASRSAIGAARA